MAVLRKVGRSVGVLVLDFGVTDGEGMVFVDWERGMGRTLTVEDWERVLVKVKLEALGGKREKLTVVVDVVLDADVNEDAAALKLDATSVLV